PRRAPSSGCSRRHRRPESQQDDVGRVLRPRRCDCLGSVGWTIVGTTPGLVYPASRPLRVEPGNPQQPTENPVWPRAPPPVPSGAVERTSFSCTAMSQWFQERTGGSQPGALLMWASALMLVEVDRLLRKVPIAEVNITPAAWPCAS